MVKINDEKFERMRAAHSTRKPPQKKKVLRKKSTPNPPPGPVFPITASFEVLPDCPRNPLVIPPPPSEVTDLVEDRSLSPEHPLKRRKKTVQPPSSSSLSEEVHHLGKCPIDELNPVPDGMDFDSETLDSLNYKGLDLTPFLADRLLFRKDFDRSKDLINKTGGLKFGKMAVLGLARSLSQILALLPLLSKQEKQLAKFRGVDPEGMTSLQSQLDQTKGELLATRGNLQDSLGLISTLKKENEVLRSAKDVEMAQAKFEMGELKASIDEKDAELAILRSQLADREKEVGDLQSARNVLQKELSKSDANAYGMFLAGFKEAKTQILHYNAPMPINVTELSTSVKMRVDSSDDEEEEEGEGGD